MNSLMYTLNNADILIASMHQKEKAIMPAFDAYYNDICRHIADKLNTDQFWTFSGEIKRPTDMQNTLSMKITAALSLYSKYTIAIWTEWSFTSIFPWIVRNTECIMLQDKRFWYTFSTCYTATISCPQRFCTNSWCDASEFILTSFLFPEEWCIIYPEKYSSTLFHRLYNNKNNWITKWITDLESAKTAFFIASKISSNNKVIIEPDFRALFCPQRMKNIVLAANQLIKQIQTSCPNCFSPWWTIKDQEGLALCHFCSSVTTYPTHEIRWCQNCAYRVKKEIDILQFPLDSCSICNP